MVRSAACGASRTMEAEDIRGRQTPYAIALPLVGRGIAFEKSGGQCLCGRSFETPAFGGLLRPYDPLRSGATHPRCGCEGYPDGPGRASRKEGESWAIIARLTWVSIRRSRAIRLRLRTAVDVARFGSSGRLRTHRPQRRSSCASWPPSMSG